MVKDSKITYDEAIEKVEAIVKELEQTEALSMEMYKQKANEAKELLNFCMKQLDAYSSEK